jgi:hypothetical protein
MMTALHSKHVVCVIVNKKFLNICIFEGKIKTMNIITNFIHTDFTLCQSLGLLMYEIRLGIINKPGEVFWSCDW